MRRIEFRDLEYTDFSLLSVSGGGRRAISLSLLRLPLVNSMFIDDMNYHK